MAEVKATVKSGKLTEKLQETSELINRLPRNQYTSENTSEKPAQVTSEVSFLTSINEL